MNAQPASLSSASAGRASAAFGEADFLRSAYSDLEVDQNIARIFERDRLEASQLHAIYHQAIAIGGTPDRYGWRIGVCDELEKLRMRGEFQNNAQAHVFMDEMMKHGYVPRVLGPQCMHGCDYLFMPVRSVDAAVVEAESGFSYLE